MVLMEFSAARGKLIQEKNQKQKSRDTVPLLNFVLTNPFSISGFDNVLHCDLPL